MGIRWKKAILCLSLQAFSVSLAHAQVAQNEETTRLVLDVSTAFFDQLTKTDFASERAFMTEDLAAMASIADWTARRQYLIDLAGPTPLYRAHAMTYYQQGGLLAAVDFWGKAAKTDTFICGFLLWEIPEPNTIGLSRIEQNVVEVDIMRSMPVKQAAQLMTEFRCPKELVEQVLGAASDATD